MEAEREKIKMKVVGRGEGGWRRESSKQELRGRMWAKKDDLEKMDLQEKKEQSRSGKRRSAGTERHQYEWSTRLHTGLRAVCSRLSGNLALETV